MFFVRFFFYHIAIIVCLSIVVLCYNNKKSEVHGMAIKLVVTDLDRTLLRNDGSISQKTRDVFYRLKQRGVKCVIATGRSAVEADYSVKAALADEYIITYTGARVTNIRTGEVVYDRFLEESTVIDILDMLREYAGIFCIVYASGRTLVLPGSFENTVHLTKHTEFFDAAKSQLAFEGDPVQYINDTHIKVNKIFLMNLSNDRLDEIENRLGEMDGISTMRTMPPGIDIVAQGVDKGRAVEALAQHLGLKNSEVMIFGDSENDASMFERGFFKVAVSNATPDIILKSDYITLSNNEDGVAVALEKLLLKDAPRS